MSVTVTDHPVRGPRQVHENFIPPSGATRALQAAINTGRKRDPFFPDTALSKEWAPYWSSAPVEKGGDMTFPSVFAFMASFLRFGIATLCLLKDADGSKLWSLGNLLTFIFVHILQIGHKASVDPDLGAVFEAKSFLSPLSVVVRYERAFRAKITHLVANKISFPMAAKVSVVDEELWTTVRNHFLNFGKVSTVTSFKGPGLGPGKGSGKSAGKGKGNPRVAPTPTPTVAPAPHSDPKPCKFIQRGEACPFGDTCKFQHVGIKRELPTRDGDDVRGKGGRVR